MQSRPVKALSENDLADLRAGRGMGLALAAELNGYPGPSHVLELADQLSLTVAQREQIRQQFESMKGEAQPLGAKLIDHETALDRLFANHTVTSENLKTAIAEIGAVQTDLRTTHLKYHLQTLQVLSPEQVQHYSSLRGYGSADGHHHHTSP
jgi:Spy/CpxP family protein refolding chaperone